MATYEARQKEYASRGQKHFYFMTLNGGEVFSYFVYPMVSKPASLK